MQKLEHKQNISVKAEPTINIESENLGVKITQSDEQEVVLKAELEFIPRHTDTEITIEDFITMKYDCESNEVSVEIEHPEVRKLTGKIELSIPASSKLNVEMENGSVHLRELIVTGTVETENGSIRFDKIDGDIKLMTENGQIVGEKLKGNLEIETENGSCKIGECEGGTIKMVTENGSISAARMLYGSATVETENGKIFYDFIPVESGEFDFKSENGKIQLIIPEEIEYDIRASTCNGRFYVGVEGDYRINNTDFGKEINKVKGSGKVKIDAETNNGSIILMNQYQKQDEWQKINWSHHVNKNMKNALGVVSKVIGRIGSELENVDINISPEDQQKVIQKIHIVGEKINQAAENIQRKAQISSEKLEGLDELGADLEKLGAELKIKLSGLGKDISESVQKEFSDLQDSPEWQTIVKRVKRVKRHEHHAHHDHQRRHEHKVEDVQQSRLQILQMLQEGKLSVEEAEKLLKAID